MSALKVYDCPVSMISNDAFRIFRLTGLSNCPIITQIHSAAIRRGRLTARRPERGLGYASGRIRLGQSNAPRRELPASVVSPGQNQAVPGK